MAAAKIKKGDSVVVLSGKDKGRPATSPGDAEGRQGRRVAASTSPPPPQAEPGEPAGWHRALASADGDLARSRSPTKDGKPTRVRFETSKDGKKVRVAVKSGETIDG